MRSAYFLALVGYFSLLALLMLWPTVLSPPKHIPVAWILIISVLPLMVPLRGLLHGRPKSFAWTAFLSLAYFAHGVTEAGADSAQRLIPALEILASVTLFLGIVLYLKALQSG